jgi:hypothetical protein
MWLVLIVASALLLFRRGTDPDDGKDWLMDITEKEQKFEMNL